jgi:thiol-disulfide isomerase/thioredoxin
LSEVFIYGKVVELQDLQHLEGLVDKAGSSLLVVFLYTRSCGVCKALLQDFQALCEEVRVVCGRGAVWPLEGRMCVHSTRPSRRQARLTPHKQQQQQQACVGGC